MCTNEHIVPMRAPCQYLKMIATGEIEEKLRGARLREERERLGLTQDAFATACGVRRRAQANYESGERAPGARYLEAAGKIGVDVGYVLDGERTTEDHIEKDALMLVLARIAVVIGADMLPDAIDAARKAYSQGFVTNDSRKVVIDLVNHALAQSPRLAGSDRSIALLSELIWQFELCLSKTGRQMSPHRKANAITMLFRGCIEAGKVNPKMIEDAVSLAAE